VRLPRAKLPLTLMLSLVPRMLAGGDRFTVDDATDAPFAYERFIADDQRPKFESWVRATYGTGAAKLGFTAKSTDDIDAEKARSALVVTVAWYGRDPGLVKQAIEMAGGWRELPVAIRGTVLQIAADADPNIHAKLLRDVKTEPDRSRRGDMFSALGAVRDAKRYEAGLELLLDPKVDFREASDMLELWSTEAMRDVAERFARTHEKQLLARMPQDTVTGAAGLMVGLYTGGCNAATRDEVATYVAEHFSRLSGAKRVIDQKVEALDQCIARRALVEPELRGWLSGIKLAKPSPAKPAKQ
jgi:cytosol alanyl aminopeptidase